VLVSSKKLVEVIAYKANDQSNKGSDKIKNVEKSVKGRSLLFAAHKAERDDKAERKASDRKPLKHAGSHTRLSKKSPELGGLMPPLLPEFF
jgi:hypothetical protein